jgi:hypothetical protein
LLDLGEPPPPLHINVTEDKPESFEDVLREREIADAIEPLTEIDQQVYDAARIRLTATA